MKFFCYSKGKNDILYETPCQELNKKTSKYESLRNSELKALEAQLELLKEKKNFIESEEGMTYLSLITPENKMIDNIGGSSSNGPKNVKKSNFKKNRTEERLRQLFIMCRALLTKLKRHANAGPFMMPIDPVKLKCPDYYEFIKNPMDLGTVTRKIKAGCVIYETPLEFRDDIRQIFVNNLLYNPGGHMMMNYGVILSAYFESLWKDSNIEEEFALIKDKLPRRSEIDLSGLTFNTPNDINNKGQSSLKKMNFLLLFKSLVRELALYVDQAKEIERLNPLQELFIKKRILSQKLEQLEQFNMENAMKIIEDNFILDDLSTNEITVDSLDENTVELLEEYIKQIEEEEKPLKTENNIIDLASEDIKEEEEAIIVNLDDLPDNFMEDSFQKRKLNDTRMEVKMEDNIEVIDLNDTENDSDEVTVLHEVTKKIKPDNEDLFEDI